MTSSSRLAESEDEIVITARDFELLREFTKQRFGLEFRDGKEALIAARLRKKIRATRSRTFAAYFRGVLSDPSGAQLAAMIDALTTNYTSFFREPAHFDFLRNVVVPAIAAPRRLSIWSAGCATGEEPYSIVFAVAQILGLKEAMGRLDVWATDISTNALRTAVTGLYRRDQAQDLPAGCLKAFWLKGHNKWAGWLRVRPEVRTMIQFERANLMDHFPRDRRLHVIFCRNVMIYFGRDTQEQIVRRFAQCLEPGGYLFVGHAETLSGLAVPFRPVAPAIYQLAAMS